MADFNLADADREDFDNDPLISLANSIGDSDPLLSARRAPQSQPLIPEQPQSQGPGIIDRVKGLFNVSPSDLGKAAAAGTVDMARAQGGVINPVNAVQDTISDIAARGAEFVTGKPIKEAARSVTGESLLPDRTRERQDDLAQAGHDIRESMSPGAKEEAAKNFIQRGPDGKLHMGDASLGTVALSGAESIPSVVAGAGEGAAFTTGFEQLANVLGRKAMATVAQSGAPIAVARLARLDKLIAAAGAGFGEASVAAPMSAQSVRDEVTATPLSVLSQSPRFQELVQAASTLPEAERLAYARDTLANELGQAAAGGVALATIMAGPLGANTASRVMRLGGAEANVAAHAARGRAGEALMGGLEEAGEEFVQSGAQAGIEGHEVSEAGNDVDIVSRMANEAIGGAAAGGAMGAGLGALTGGHAEHEPAPVAVKPPVDGGPETAAPPQSSPVQPQPTDTAEPESGPVSPLDVGKAAKAARDAGVDPQAMQVISQAVVRREITPADAVAQLNELIAEKEQPATPDEAPAAMGVDQLPTPANTAPEVADVRGSDAGDGAAVGADGADAVEASAGDDGSALGPEPAAVTGGESAARPAAATVESPVSAPKKRNLKTPDAKVDSALEFITKSGGINRGEAESEGFDPADMKAARVGIRHAFNAKGMTLESAGEALAQAGYAVTDDTGAVDKNKVIDLIGRELRGQKGYSAHRDSAEIEREHAELARIHAEAEADDPFAAPGTPKFAEHDEPVRAFAVLRQQAEEAGASDDEVEHALEAQDDIEAERRLRALINRGNDRGTRSEAQADDTGAVGENPRPGEGTGAPTESASSAREEGEGLQLTQQVAPKDTARAPAPKPQDLFGAAPVAQQALADAQRTKDAKRNSGQASVETGDASDMFSQARQQTDLTDAAPAKRVTFKTAKGSTYTVDERGRTTRDKAARPEHPGESGPQPTSEATYYVSSEDAQKLGEFQTEGGPGRAIASVEADRIGIRYTDGKDAGKVEKRTVVPIHEGPAVGLTPVETWKNGQRVHFGNPITEVSGSADGTAQNKGRLEVAKERHKRGKKRGNEASTNLDKYREPVREAFGNSMNGLTEVGVIDHLKHAGLSDGDAERASDVLWEKDGEYKADYVPGRGIIFEPKKPARGNKSTKATKVATPATSEVETVKPGEKGGERYRTDKALKKYLLAKRPEADKTQQITSYRTEATVGYNQAKADGAPQEILDQLRTEREWAVSRLNELEPDYDWDRLKAKNAPESDDDVTELPELTPDDTEPAEPTASKNTVFTDADAEKARALLRKKLGQVSAGVDPEILQAGITLAGYHIEKGARTFAAYAQAMLADLGESVRPYLKSWYMGVKYDPRASGFDGMSAASEVEAANVEDIESAERSGADLEPDSRTGDTEPVRGAVHESEPGRDDGRDAGAGRQTRSAGNRPGRGDGVSAAGAAGGRKGRNQPVRASESERPPVAAGSDFSERGLADREPGILSEHVPAKAVEAAARKPLDLEAKRAAQRAADSTPVKLGDRDNIAKTLPFLNDGQQDDVAVAEARHAKPDGYGMMFTNGTGTGKTYTGLGIVKRFVRRGKSNIIVVAPNDKILSDWIRSGKNLGLNISQLESTSTAGKGVVAATYANFGQNRDLAKRKWDLIVTDESHYLGSNADGTLTDSGRVLRALAYHPDGAYQRAIMLNPELYDRMDELRARLDVLSAIKNPTAEEKQEDAEKSEELNQLRKQWQPKVDAAKADVEANQGEARPRVTFLSATPFAYRKSIEYAEGFMFDYPKDDGTGGYNTPRGRESFFTQHFGYRMRYNKLTEPDADVDTSVMETQFNGWLKQQGVLSSRMLDVDADYERKFVLVSDAIGRKIDEALEFLREKYSPLMGLLKHTFDYHNRMYLLEAIKAKAFVPIIKAELKAGRKVVIFHDFNKGGAFHPFRFPKNGTIVDAQGNTISLASMVSEFEAERPDLVNLDFDADSPLVTMKREFPGALFFNGTVPKAARLADVDKFNSDDGNHNLLVVQSDAGREGISLHDTSGKYRRTLINLGMPVRPTAAIQIEGRTRRTGSVSDALYLYGNTGTFWERYAFATKIAERASTAENLAMGEDARALKDAYVQAFEDAVPGHKPSDTDGRGGRAADKASRSALTEFQKARTFYFAQLKKTSKTKAREGIDYFATPEPLGYKMVEWAGLRPGEAGAEPSVGHGAIGRFFPATSRNTFVEPSSELASRASLVVPGKVLTQRFEDLHLVNKFDVIVMNPPFGVGGKTAMDHLEKASQHLREGGRIVALIPRGNMADKRFERWLHGTDDEPGAKGIYLTADIDLPSVTFARAGTNVSAHIVVLDKVADPKDAPNQVSRDYRSAEDINEFFDRIEHGSVPDRPAPLEGARDAAPETVAAAPAAAAAEAPFKLSEASDKNGPVYLAKPSKYLGEKFGAELRRAKKTPGAYYNSFRRAFVFKSAEGRQKFIDERPDGLYARGEHSGGSTGDEVRDWIGEASQAVAGVADVRVVDNVEALRAELNQPDIPPDVKGVYESGGRVYLVADQLADREEAERVFTHEVFGHFAMERNADMRRAIGMVQKLRAMGSRSVGALWNEVALTQPGLDPGTHAKEVIALMAERGVKNDIIGRILDAVKEFLRTLKLKASFGEFQLRQMIARAARALREDAAALPEVDEPAANRAAQAFADGDDEALGQALDSMSIATKPVAPIMEKTTLEESDRPAIEDAIAEQLVGPPGLYARGGPPQQDDISRLRRRVMANAQHEGLPLKDRVRMLLQRITGISGLEIRRGMIDDKAYIAAYEKMLNGGKLMDASVSPYKQAVQTQNLPGVMTAVMHTGVPVWKDGTYVRAPGRKGIVEIFSPLVSGRHGNVLPEWELYAAARRASRLIQEKNADGSSREKLFSQADIDLALGLSKTYPEFEKVFDEWQGFNKQTLDMAQEAGLIDPEARSIWESNDYVPFYRAMEQVSGRLNPVSLKKAIANQRAKIKTLTGRDMALSDVFESMLMNTAHLVDSSFKNRAAQTIVETFEGIAVTPARHDAEPVDIDVGQVRRALEAANIPLAQQLTPEQNRMWLRFFRMVKPRGDNIVTVMYDGKPKYYEVLDPGLYKGIVDMSPTESMRWLDLLGFTGAKRLLTRMATATPSFMVRNFIRDTQSAWVQNHVGLKPFISAANGFREYLANKPLVRDLMLAGAGGHAIYDNQPGNIKKVLLREMKDHNARGVLSSVMSPRKWWHAYTALQQASENANRIAVYKASMARGATHAEAAFQAHDVLNFQQRGAWAGMQFAVRVIPFLNARVQGLDRLARGYKENRGRFALKGAMLTLATIALMAAGDDDDRYQELEEWDRDTYWHFWTGKMHWRIPKGFEVGSLFATLPERAIRLMRGQDKGRATWDSVKRMVLDTFSFNPIPQLMKPMIEDVANYDFFSGRPIVGELEGEKIPELQAKPWTSPTLVELAEAMPDFMPPTFRSPERLEHLVRGYTASIGTGFVLPMADRLTRAAGGYPDAPEKPWYETAGAGFVTTSEPRNTKWTAELYRMQEAADGAAKAVKDYAAAGQMDRAREIIKERGGQITARPKINAVVKELRDLNRTSRMIEASRMSGEAKQAALEKVNGKRDDLARQIAPYADLF